MVLMLKKIIKKIGTPFFGVITMIAKRVCSIAYFGLFASEWIVDNPENFDHEIDLYWGWGSSGRPDWLERGIYSIQALKMFEKPTVVELCCGDGFNAKYFYSISADKVMACDFDKRIIRTARKKNQRENIVFKVADIRDGINNIFNAGGVTNIIWDMAIEHFTPKEIDSILRDIKSVLAGRKGILSGCTIVERSDGKSLPQHEYEFKSMEDLMQFLTPYFKNVFVFETIYPSRHNLYFYASEGAVPFDIKWKHGLRS